MSERTNRIVTIARHEYRSATRSRLLLGLTGVLVVATIASIYIGAAEHASQLADYQAYVDQATAAGVQRVAPAPFALLALLRGAMEYLEIIGAVIAITLGYLSVSRERANRTLALLRSRPLSAGEHAAGSALGALQVFALLVAVTGVVGVVGLGLVGHDWINLAQAIKLLLAYTAATIYLMVFWMLGAIATTKARNPINGLTVALGVWLVVVLILPQIGDTLDADNQLPGGLFAALGLGRTGEEQILAHFAGYERVRTTIEALSFEKHFERFAFAMVDVKARLRDLSLGELLRLKAIEVIWLVAPSGAMAIWLRRSFRTQPTIQHGGQA